MRFERRLIRVKHDGQMPTCRKCNQEARHCSNLICFNCDAVGHVNLECNAGDICSVCKDHGHFAVSCPLLNEWDRDAPVDDRPDVPHTSQPAIQDSQPSVEFSSPFAPIQEPSSSPGSSSSSCSGSSSSSSSNPPLPALFDESGQDVDDLSMDVQANESPPLFAQETSVSETEMTAAAISQPDLFSPDDPMSLAKRPA